MRLLVLNANTSEFVTRRVADAVRAMASPGTEIVEATGSFGGRVIGTWTEMAIGEHAAVELMARHAPGCDAVLVAVAMTEAALLTARQLGGRFGFVTFDARSMALYRTLIEGHGFGARLAAWRVVDSRAVYTPEGALAVDAQVADAINDMAERDGIEVAVISGAVMAGAGPRLQPRCVVPVVEGVAAAFRQAEALVRLGAAKARTGAFAAPAGRESTGIGDALAAALRGDGGGKG